jgi:hypothetical protein
MTVEIKFKHHDWALPFVLTLEGCPSLQETIDIFSKKLPKAIIIKARVVQQEIDFQI